MFLPVNKFGVWRVECLEFGVLRILRVLGIHPPIFPACRQAGIIPSFHHSILLPFLVRRSPRSLSDPGHRDLTEGRDEVGLLLP